MSRPRARHPAVAGILLGAAVAVTALVLSQHFADTRNWAGIWSVLGGFLAFMIALDIWARAGRKRVTGTYSYSPARVERARRRQQGRQQ